MRHSLPFALSPFPKLKQLKKIVMNRGSEGVSPFTVTQWQELEHQALIYKYIIAGLSVPPDLVLLIQNSFGTSSSAFFHRPTLGYCGRENSLYGIGIGIGYGKKIDPEPGRCRRTDGKKWRCAKEAYPDSKYCERHMHRGRSRSRKHVESQSLASSSLSSSSMASTVSGMTQSIPLKFNAFASAGSTTAPTSNPNSNHSQFQLDSIPYAIPTKHYSRHLQGSKPEANEHRSFSQCSGGDRSLLMDSAMDNTWSSLSRVSPQMSSFSQSKPMDSSTLHDNYSRQSFINCELDQPQPVKQGNRSLHPFFEEWPNTREVWSGLEDESGNQVSFSKTQLSISVPMATLDFSTRPPSPQES